MDLFSKKSSGRRKLAVCMFAALFLLIFAVALVPQQEAQKAPDRQYEDNEVKKSKIFFSRPSGVCPEPFMLTISAPTKEIYYTLDGRIPERGAEGTLKYTGALKIGDATEKENVHSMRTDTTTGFDLEAVEELSKGRRPMNYQVPDYKVDKCTILRVVYYDVDGKKSSAETRAYFVGFGDREGYGNAMVLSLVTDPDNLFGYDKGIYVTGRTFDEFAAADSFHNNALWYRHFWWWWDANYRNSGRDWERQANVQFFDENGELLLQQDAGIRIQGGGSRGFLPKSLNLYARKDYDGNSRFHCDFFGTGYEAKRLTLTSCGDDCYTKLKDRLVSEKTAEQGFATMHYRPCLLFLDGEYWGFYYLTEKYDEKYFSYYYQVPEEDVLEIKNNEVEVGEEEDLALYQTMKTFIEDNDMSDEDHYRRACELIDMDSFINYYAVLIYCGRCGDWPTGNFALWRTRDAENPDPTTQGITGGNSDLTGRNAGQEAPKENAGNPYMDGRWRWILFDVNSAAISEELADHDTLDYVLKIKTDTMKMFGSLWANEEFRQTFSARLLEYGSTVFSPEAIDEAVDLYEDEMAEAMGVHFRRFFGEDSGLDFCSITDREIRGFFKNRYEIAQKMLEDKPGEAWGSEQ